MTGKGQTGFDATMPSSTPAAADAGATDTVVSGEPVMDPVERFARGASLGRYVVLDRLGGGGMGVVYAAYDPELDRRVAVKLLRHDATIGTEGRTRLIREAQAMARLSHPNVIAVHDVGTLEGEVFVAMEFVDGKTLADAIEEKGRRWAELLPLFVQAGRGLEAAHTAGLVHRDFKPENVLVGHDGRVRVLDFGLARAHGTADARVAPLDLEKAATDVGSGGALATPLTRTGAFMGTPAYMAPEQLLAHPTDARTDQFAFCVALYEAVYGVRPFGGDTVAELLAEVVQGNVRTPPHACNTPYWLERAILRGLKTKPEQRWPSMRELLDTLENDAIAIRRKKRAIVAGAGLVIIAAVGAVAVRRPALPPACEGATQKLAGVWDGARKEAVHAAFARTGLPIAEEAYTRTAALLDGWSATYLAMHKDACEATAVRHEQSPQALDARMQCLAGRLDELRAASDLLARADATVVKHAIDLAQSLDTVDGCGKVSALRAPLDPPADAATRAQVAALRQKLAAVKALADASRLGEARSAAMPLVDEARATRYQPVIAEALFAQALVLSQLGDFAGTTPLVDEAIDVATASRHDEFAAHAWIVATHTQRLQQRYDDARVAAAHAGAFLQRMGGDPFIQARLEMELARMGDRKPDEGLQHAARAVDLVEKAYGEKDPLTLVPRAVYLSLLVQSGRFDEAIKLGERIVAESQATLGPSHLSVGIAEINLGEALSQLGRLDQAEPHLRRGLDLFEQLAPGHTLIGFHLWKLADLERRAGRLKEAEALLDRSIALIEKTQNAIGGQEARAMRAHVWVLEGRAREALPVLEVALPATRAASSDANDLGRIELPLGMAVWEVRGDHSRARALVEQAREHLRFPLARAEAEAWLSAHPK